MTVRACLTSRFSYFLSKTQSEIITESEHGRGGMEGMSCMREKEKVRPSPLGKWEEEGTTESSMITGQHERANLNPMVTNFK